MGFVPDPQHVRINRLFDASLNRYRVAEGLWIGSERQSRRQSLLARANQQHHSSSTACAAASASASAGGPSPTGRSTSKRSVTSSSSGRLTNLGGSFAAGNGTRASLPPQSEERRTSSPESTTPLVSAVTPLPRGFCAERRAPIHAPLDEADAAALIQAAALKRKHKIERAATGIQARRVVLRRLRSWNRPRRHAAAAQPTRTVPRWPY